MLAKRFGGAERLFVDLVAMLAYIKHDVLAICHAGSEVEKTLKKQSDITVKTVQVFSTRDPLAWRVIRAKIQEHDSDIVQSHLSRGTYLAGKACRRLKKPLVVTLHNYINLKYYKDVTKFIPATSDQFNYLCQQGISEKKIGLIPHFSHLNPVAEPSFSNNERLIYGCYGRLVNKKGFHVLLNAFEMLRKNTSAKLIIGGDGSDMKKLKALTAKLELQERVQFIGWVTDVESFLKSIDIFVLPSIDEPFSITTLEAMAMGKIIISTKSQGPKEMLNSQNAYLGEVNNARSLCNIMAMVEKDKVGRELKAVRALADYKNFYSKQVVVPKFLDLYEQTVLDWSKRDDLNFSTMV